MQPGMNPYRAELIIWIDVFHTPALNSLIEQFSAIIGSYFAQNANGKMQFNGAHYVAPNFSADFFTDYIFAQSTNTLSNLYFR